MACEYQFDEEGQVIRFNCLKCIFGSSIEDYDVCMANVIERLMEIKRVVRIVFAESREYEYDLSECRMLFEIANAIESISKNKIISIKNIVSPDCDSEITERYSFLQKILIDLKYDPIEGYKKLVREIRHVKIKAEKEDKKICAEHYIKNTLLPIQTILDSCRMIQEAKPFLGEHKNRSLYRKMFHPTVRPNFMYTRYISTPPPDVDLVEKYKIAKSTIEIYSQKDKTRKLYHIIPPEFRLNEDEYNILDIARRYLGRHEPRETELQQPDKMRENLYRIGLDMISDIARTNNINVSEERLKELAEILTRYTAGFGILELMLQDEKIQDIYVNSPVGSYPIYIFHGDFDECETNLIPTREDADSWATRFRLISGRPLDEANPVLDTELFVPGGRARVSAITRSLSPDGLGFAFRRHRDKPWTLPLFIKNRAINSFSAGLLWFLIDGSRTMLIAGTRSSGKSSFLGACMVQIMPKLRIITLEDTLELPVEQLRDMGHNIERLKSRSVITHIDTELPAEEALRTALRLGDSCLIVGEVRSREALALYEAMRIGALANLVAGTIHGDSAYGVFDRVVNDLGVPITSFKATDIVLICNMLKTPDGLKSLRRVVELTEVRKHWKQDPYEEGGFVNLLEYSAGDDILKATKTLQMGESQVLNSIASRVREWKGRWDSVWENINTRAKIFSTLVEYSEKSRRPDMLEAPFVISSNTQYSLISGEVKEETGSLDNAEIYERWHHWLRSKV